MLAETEMRGKSDAELLGIWQNQLDYRDEVIGWVGTEIQRRGLDTTQMEFLTAEDQADRENEWYRSIFSLRLHAGIGMIGVILICGGAALFWEGLSRKDALLIAIPLGAIGLGALVVYLACRSWKRRKLSLESRRWKRLERSAPIDQNPI